ncbi:hypothetical protein BDR07DRAFT_1379075 [Suillus spraguei]|nr:hypothetical protein BDR07DRAFT_1379075 [Suillus spraguei]
MTMAVSFLSLPTELICYILILLNPRDISHCAMNSVEVQYKLEIYAQGLISTETATTNSDSISRKMCSLKKLASIMRQPDFHANIIFETALATTLRYTPDIPPPSQSVKCGLWWTDMSLGKFCTQDCEARDCVFGTFIQVINWRNGYANNKIIATSSEDSISLTQTYIHGHPLFHGEPAHPELMPSYVPSLESQIMVLEIVLAGKGVILVVNMAIFSDAALNLDMPIEIPWSDWGPQHMYYFPHHFTHNISVFGSKMAYALPQDRIPDPGQRLEELPAQGYFYMHIWNFNQRFIACSECINDPNSLDCLICKPGPMPDSFGKEMFSNHAYTVTICHTPFSMFVSRIFLEQDRLTLTWVISLVLIEAGPHTKERGLSDDNFLFSASMFFTVTLWSADYMVLYFNE